MQFKNQNNFSVSNILIGVSVLFTAVSFLLPSIFLLGMNKAFLESGVYYIFFIQIFSSQFLHGGLLHLFFNSIFIYYFGNELEIILGKKKYILFFVLTSIFLAGSIIFFSSGNHIGISGFCMAVITYYTLHLKTRNINEYKGGITAIVINVLIGLHPGISFIGHLAGVVFGGIFYLGNKIIGRK